MKVITRERLGVFGDAVIAIILTVMALDLPINIVHGRLDLVKLIQAIGIYAVSFSFIGNLWIQHASLFASDESVSNQIIINDLVFVFLLSLMPAFTKAMFEDTETITVAIYGILCIIVQLVFYRMYIDFIKSREKNKSISEQFFKRYNRIYLRNMWIQFGLYLFAVMGAFVSPIFALTSYVVITCITFFRNTVDRRGLRQLSRIPLQAQKSFFRLTPEQQNEFYKVIRNYTQKVYELYRDHKIDEDQLKTYRNQVIEYLKKEYNLNDQEAQSWLQYGLNVLRVIRRR